MERQPALTVIDWSDVRCACVIALCAAIGAMVALTITVAALPAPTSISDGHPIILDSQVTQFHLEPREKGFYILVMLLSSIFGLIGTFVQQHFRSANWLLIGCLLLDVVVINHFGNQALNNPEGLYWGLYGTLVSGLVALGAAFGGRFESLSHR
jgi:hypothetical protein